MNITFSVLLLLTIVGCVYGADQDLCANRVSPGTNAFADDPSDCAAYLWCNYNSNNELVSVHQASCPTGFLFDGTTGKCDGNFTCTAQCQHNTGATRVFYEIWERSEIT